jgi:hypothetical protein
MRIIINNTKKNFSKTLTSAIARKGYTVYKKEGGGYGVCNLEQIDQDILKNMVAQLCDHHNVDYEIPAEINQ